MILISVGFSLKPSEKEIKVYQRRNKLKSESSLPGYSANGGRFLIGSSMVTSPSQLISCSYVPVTSPSQLILGQL